MPSPPDPNPRDRGTKAGAVPALALCALFLALVWPVILAGSVGTSESYDQRTYHLPVIRTMAGQWPHVDIVNYRSTTSPGYHLGLALVVRFVTDAVRVLQLLSSLAALGLVLVVWRYAARAMDGPVDRPPPGWAAVLLVLPLLASTYVIGGAIWLTTDNAALLFVALALGGAALGRTAAPATILRAVFAAAAVGVRQIHVWVSAPVAVAAFLASPPGARMPALLRPDRPVGWIGSLAGVLALLLPFALLGWLVSKWGGLTPPAYAHIHATGVNPANLVMILALFGGFGVFFMPVLAGGWRRWLPLDGIGLLVFAAVTAVCLACATSFDKDAGRWGGPIWEVVRRGPTAGERSLLLCPLAGYGGLVLLRAARTVMAAGRGRELTVLLVGLAGWSAAQAFNAQAWQRYCEPMVLIVLVWLAAMAVSASGPPRRWWIGPAILTMLQMTLLLRGVYFALEPAVQP